MKVVKWMAVCLVLVVSFVIAICKLVQSETNASDLVLQNIEALATDDGVGYICVGEGNRICPVSGARVKMVIITTR